MIMKGRTFKLCRGGHFT